MNGIGISGYYVGAAAAPLNDIHIRLKTAGCLDAQLGLDAS